MEHTERDGKWWSFFNWIWEMCRAGKRTWEHPNTEEEVLELKAHFEETCPGWKRGDAVKDMPSQAIELPSELPF